MNAFEINASSAIVCMHALAKPHLVIYYVEVFLIRNLPILSYKQYNNYPSLRSCL